MRLGTSRQATSTAASAAVLVAIFALVALAAPAEAGAARATGNTTLVLSAGAQKQLDKRGIRFAGVRGAVSEGRRTRLQVSGGWVGSLGAVLNHRGAIRIVAGEGRERRVVRLTSLQTRLGGNSVVRGKIDGKGRKRRVLFFFVYRVEQLALDGLRGTASLRGARLHLPRYAAEAISRRLGVPMQRNEIGSGRVGAVARATDQPISGPVGDEPPLLARPASAIDIADADLTWHVRSSWIIYASSGSGATPIEGATARPAIPETEHPCFDPNGPGDTPEAGQIHSYGFEFPFASGWYDEVSGTAALYGSGGVHFAYPGHGIDFATRNPEIEINGSSSRAIFRLRGSGATAYPDKRAAILDLAPTSPLTGSPPGPLAYPGEIKASLTRDGEAVFTGFYSGANNGFGCFSVSFSTD